MQNILLHRHKECDPSIDFSFETKDHFITIDRTTHDQYIGDDAEYSVEVIEQDSGKVIRSINTGTDDVTIEQAIAVAFCSISNISYELQGD